MTSLAEWNRPENPASSPTTVLERIVAILDAVNDSGSSGLSVTALAARTSLPKSTVSRLVGELVDARYLDRADDGVTLGIRLFELGTRASLPRQLLAAAAPVIRELVDLTGERVALWVYQGTHMISVAAVAGRLPMLPARPGMRTPALTTASGKAFLAFCEDRNLVKRATAALAGSAADQFRDELSQVRATVVANDRGIAYPGIVAVATPVLSPDHRVLGAISVAGPSGAMDSEHVGAMVRAAGVALTRRLTAA